MKRHILIVVLAATVAQSAGAYCILDSATSGAINRFAVGGSKNGDAIPVYLVTAGTDSVLDDPAKTISHGVGLNATNLESQVKAACRAWSEGPANLNLYYAGQRSNNTPVEGIIIVSNDVRLPNTGGSTSVSAGVNGGRVQIKAFEAGVTEYSLHPPSTSLPGHVSSLRSVLMHEMRHIIGGDSPHPEQVNAACPATHTTNEAGWCSNSADPSCIGQNSSTLSLIMAYPTPDDFLAAVDRYGPRSRTLQGRSSPSGAAGSWVNDLSMSILSTVPPAISAGSLEYNVNAGSAIVSTTNFHRLMVDIDTGSGYGSQEAVGGGIAVNTTVMRPMVAIGDGKLVVQWVSMDDLTCDAAPIETCTKTLSSGAWSCSQKTCASSNTPRSSQQMVAGLGFEPVSRDFITTYALATENLEQGALVSSSAGTIIGNIEILGVPFVGESGKLNPSKSACQPMLIASDTTAECYTASLDYGSYLFRPRIYELDVNETVSPHDLIEVDDSVKLLGSYGMIDLATGASNAFVLTRGDNGTTATVTQFTGQTGTTYSNESFTTNHWPIAVGVMRTWTTSGFPPIPVVGSTRFRIVWGS